MIDETLKTANILIVDDQQANVDILASFLKKQGYSNIKTLMDSREVIPQFDTYKPDLILLDLLMPYYTGFEILEQLQVKIPINHFLPVLVLTADVTPEAKQKALSMGAHDFLIKPFDLIEVGLRIRNLLFTSFLQQQLELQNQELENKVKIRTSELEATNKELILAKDKAEASDRLKTAFIMNISHEIRTPLNGILGFAELIANPSFDNERKASFFPVIRSSCKRLLNTMTDYLDMSLIVSDNMEVNIQEVILSDALDITKNRFNEEICIKKLTFDLNINEEDKLFKFKTDSELFAKVLHHLFDNAIKFTKSGSISCGFKRSANLLELYVKDTGKGIEEEAQGEIFKLFMQENNSMTRGYEGSGIGLTIVKGILKLLGGQIHFKSEINKGTTFFVSLPLDINLREKVKRDIISIKPNTDSKPIILIAEDDEANYEYMSIFLDEYAKEIILATNGKEAVEQYKIHPEISLVIMDIKMPVMDGLEATRQIKAINKEVPILAVTAFAMKGDEQKVFDAGCDDYLPKPITGEKLLAKIRACGFKI